jgi:hypothetical protein
MMSPADLLRKLATMNEMKTAEYHPRNGDIDPFTFAKHGAIMATLFAGHDGIKLQSEHDFNRYHLLVQICVKLARYVENFEQGGHQDSIHDLAVYAAMLGAYDVRDRSPTDRRADVDSNSGQLSRHSG